MSKQRIAKVIANTGIASRRKAEALIEKGFVRLNGRILKEVATKVDPQKDIIEVHGKRLYREKKITIAFNKPRGYLTTKNDTHGRKTVFDLLPSKFQKLHPVGRLDKETSGLLLFTNDGGLTNQITHPKFEVLKTYQVSVEGRFDEKDRTKLEKGIQLPEFNVSPCHVSEISFEKSRNRTRLFFTIGEGKKREVRRIFEFLGYNMLRLHRVKIGNLGLRGIRMGNFRLLEKKDIEKVFE